MKKVLFILLLVLSLAQMSYGQNKWIMANNDQGNNYMLGMNLVRSMYENTETGGTILVTEYGEDGSARERYYTDDDLATVIANSCGLFFEIFDLDEDRRVGLSVVHVDYIGEHKSDGRAYIKMHRVSGRHDCRDLYVDLIGVIATCGGGSGGGDPPQTLNWTNPSLCISNGNCVDLSDLDTDNQQVTTFSVDELTNVLTLDIEDDGQAPHTVDLSFLLGGGSGGGDNWGTQVVVTDGTTIIGNGTVTNPLSVNNSGLQFVLSGNIGPFSTIVPGDNLSITGKDILQVEGDGLDGVEVSIDVSSASNGDVLYFDGTNIQWGGSVGGGGDNWGIQTAVTDGVTILGDGTTGNPLMADLSSITEDQSLTLGFDNLTNILTYSLTEDPNSPGTVDLSGIGGGVYQNGLNESGGVVELGGHLLHNTIIDQLNFDFSFTNVGQWIAQLPDSGFPSVAGDAILLNNTYGAALIGGTGSNVSVQGEEITVEGGLGKTFWGYGATPFPVGSFLQMVDAGSREIYYAPYTLPTTNAGGAGYCLETDATGNLTWIMCGTGGGTGGYSFNVTDGVTSETINDTDNLGFVADNLLYSEVSAIDQVKYGIDITNADPGDVITYDGTNIFWGAGGTGGGGDDHDWYEDGTSASPGDINDDIFTNGNVGINASPIETLTVSGDISTNGSGNALYWSQPSNTWKSWATGQNLIFEPELNNGSIDFKELSGANQFRFNMGSGDVTFYSYPETRDDTGAHSPLNFFYTDNVGTVLSAPISSLTSGLNDDHDWYEVGTTSAPNSINDNIYTMGQAGIGTNNPNYRLHVQDGSVYINRSIGNARAIWENPSNSWSAGNAGTGYSIKAGNIDADFSIRDVANADAFIVETTGGDLIAPAYPDSRDDSAFFAPNNVLYTDNTGRVLSAPYAALGGGDDFFITDGNVTQTIEPNNTILFEGQNLIISEVDPTDKVTTSIDVTGAADGNVIVFNAGNVEWGIPGTGTSDFDIKDGDGDTENVNLIDGDEITFTDNNLIDVQVLPTDQVAIGIDDTGATTDQVIVFDGTGPVWADVPSSGATDFDITGQSGGPENIDLSAGDGIDFIGSNLLTSDINATDQVEYSIDPSSGTDGDVITLDNGNVVWGTGNSGFSFDYTDGTNTETVDATNNVQSFAANSVLEVSVGGATVTYDITPGTSDQILTTDTGGNVVWADPPGLNNICATAPSDGDILIYDSVNSEWCPDTPPTGADDWGNGNFKVEGDVGTELIEQQQTLFIKGGNVVETLVQATDEVIVSITEGNDGQILITNGTVVEWSDFDITDIAGFCNSTPTDGQIFVYDAVNSEWCPEDASTFTDTDDQCFTASSGLNLTNNLLTLELEDCAIPLVVDLNPIADDFSFIFEADSGTQQTIDGSDGERLHFEGLNLITTTATSNDNLFISLVGGTDGQVIETQIIGGQASPVWVDKNLDDFLCATAPTDGDVITWDATNSEWCPEAPTGGYTFSVEGNVGGPDQINSGETLNIVGSEIMRVNMLANNFFSVFINTIGANVGDVLTFTGSDPQWQAPSGASFTADNALTLTGTDLDWGGALTQTNTVVSGSGTERVAFSVLNAFDAEATDVSVQTVNGSNGIEFTTAPSESTLFGSTVNIGNANNGSRYTIPNDTPSNAGLTGGLYTYGILDNGSLGGTMGWIDLNTLGSGDFDISGDVGTNQNIDLGNGDGINFTGSNLISSQINATDEVEYMISTSGATTNQVISFDGTNAVWANATGGVGDDWGSQVVFSDATLTGTGVTGSPLSVVGNNLNLDFDISDGTNTQNVEVKNTGSDVITFTGSGLIDATVGATDNVDYSINTSGATANEVILFNGTNAIWATPPAAAATNGLNNSFTGNAIGLGGFMTNPTTSVSGSTLSSLHWLDFDDYTIETAAGSNGDMVFHSQGLGDFNIISDRDLNISSGNVLEIMAATLNIEPSGGLGLTGSFLQNVNSSFGTAEWSSYRLPLTAGSIGEVLTMTAGGTADWQPAGGGNTYQNGLTETSGTVELGGNLLSNTTIDGQSSNSLFFNNMTQLTGSASQAVNFNSSGYFMGVSNISGASISHPGTGSVVEARAGFSRMSSGGLASSVTATNTGVIGLSGTVLNLTSSSNQINVTGLPVCGSIPTGYAGGFGTLCYDATTGSIHIE